MDDVFGDTFAEKPTPGQEVAQEQERQASTVEQEPEQQAEAGSEGDSGATTAQENSKHVPLAALEAERRGRQDWKEKAIRYEEELKALRNQSSQQSQGQQQEVPPEQALRQQILNERFNFSEMMARQAYKEAGDLEEMVNIFGDAAKANPALAMQLNQHPHPWEFAYQEGKKLKVLQEMGNDPIAYRDRVRAEIRAEMEKTGALPATPTQAAAPAAPQLPQSLAGARSSASRQATTFTGPAPLGSIFAN